MMRTHRCGELRTEHGGSTVELCGWVHTRRDHGGVIFIDLRDTSGLVQLVFNPDASGDIFTTAEQLRSEYCIKVTGEVRPRPEGTVNPEPPDRRDRGRGDRDRDLLAGRDPAFPGRLASRRRRDAAPQAPVRRPSPPRDAAEPQTAPRDHLVDPEVLRRARASPRSRHRCSPARHPRERATTSFPRASTPGSSTHCRRAHSSSSSC